jgi:hypothetical protein
MNVPGNAHYNALSLGYAYINNFLEGLKVSMIMHPSTHSFLFLLLQFLPPLHPAEVVCTLFRATPLPIPKSEERTEKSSSIGCEAYSNLALDKYIETSLVPEGKKKGVIVRGVKAGHE